MPASLLNSSRSQKRGTGEGINAELIKPDEFHHIPLIVNSPNPSSRNTNSPYSRCPKLATWLCKTNGKGGGPRPFYVQKTTVFAGVDSLGLQFLVPSIGPWKLPPTILIEHPISKSRYFFSHPEKGKNKERGMGISTVRYQTSQKNYCKWRHPKNIANQNLSLKL